MGIETHHCIVVTSWNNELLKEAHETATALFSIDSDDFLNNKVAEITPEVVNGYASFLIAPDGSKAGWEHSDAGDKARDVFIAWINSKAYDDGGNSLQYVEVQYGETISGEPPKITRHNG